MAQKEGISFFEVSAKTDENIKNMFYNVVVELPNFAENNSNKENLIKELMQENGVQNVVEGIYSFNGIYEPTNIYTVDRTRLFLKTDGYLYYPLEESKGRLKGMRAYFVAPAGSSGVKVMVDDDFSTMIEAIPDDIIPTVSDVYTISGQHVGNSLEGHPKGVYIVNGKKLLIK